jgi:hypothetical protein
MKRDLHSYYGMNDVSFGALYTGEDIDPSANFTRLGNSEREQGVSTNV